METATIQTVSRPVLTSGYPDPGQVSKVFRQGSRTPIKFPGERRADSSIAGHLIDDTFGIAANLQRFMSDPQINQCFEAVDQSQILGDIRTCLAFAQKKAKAPRNFHAILFKDPSVTQQANGHGFTARGMQHAIKSKNVHKSLMQNSDARSRRCLRKKNRELQEKLLMMFCPIEPFYSITMHTGYYYAQIGREWVNAMLWCS